MLNSGDLVFGTVGSTLPPGGDTTSHGFATMKGSSKVFFVDINRACQAKECFAAYPRFAVDMC